MQYTECVCNRCSLILSLRVLFYATFSQEFLTYISFTFARWSYIHELRLLFLLMVASMLKALPQVDTVCRPWSRSHQPPRWQVSDKATLQLWGGESGIRLTFSLKLLQLFRYPPTNLCSRVGCQAKYVGSPPFKMCALKSTPVALKTGDVVHSVLQTKANRKTCV